MKIAECQSTTIFVDVTKMVSIGSGAERPVSDTMMTRYACYLAAQNADPTKAQVAFAQTYLPCKPENKSNWKSGLPCKSRLDARQKLRESETALSKKYLRTGGR